MANIFVQIASYRDPELFPTLKDITKQADNPQHLNITVCWQHGEEESIEDFLDGGFDVAGFNTYTHTETDGDISEFDIIEMSLNEAMIQVISVDYTKTRGTCWARNLIQQMYNGETYTLQLDSHHRFIKGWDTVLIEMLEDLREQSPKPVLTGYLPSYDPENDPKGRVNHPYQMNFDRFIPEGAVFFIPSQMEDWKKRDTPLKARFYSGHFTFADGSFADEVQHDVLGWFHGEEISISVRAFTHGYDLYHPHKVIAWHEYTRKNRVKVWDDHTTAAKEKKIIDKDWVERNNMAHKRNRILFGMDGEDPNQVDFGKYGFGTERTLRDYEEYAGISFEYRGVQQATIDKEEPPVNFEYNTEIEWKNSFARSNDIRVCLHKNEFGNIMDDIDFVFLGAHDADGKELYRKDLTDKEFYRYINSENGFIDHRLIFLTSEKPQTYTIWPHSKSGGWLEKVTKPVE